jgi:hypothetical protein
MDDLARSLEGTGHAGWVQLEQAIREIVGEHVLRNGPTRVVPLKKHVFRLTMGEGSEASSLVLKCMDPVSARRIELVSKRWLPAIGLDDAAPALLGVAAEPKGQRVWHVYEDLGDTMLDDKAPDRARVEAAVELIARLHVLSAEHPLLAECRHRARDVGIRYFACNVRDAIRGLEALGPPAIEFSPEQCDLRERLLGRLYPLHDELPERARQMDHLGGPELLLHGDLWTINTSVVETPGGLRARLIDWEHAAVGPYCYDLSTFLYRFQASERTWILEAYRRFVARSGWLLPAAEDLNHLFDTAERARYANRVVWPTIALLQGDPGGWELDELAEVDRWFEALEPVLVA